MKLFLSTWSLHRLLFDRALTLHEMPGLGRSLGFHGIELEDIWFPSTDRRFCQTLRRRARESGSAVLIAISNDFTVTGARQFRAQVSHTMRFMEIASMFGSRVVRVLTGSRDPKRKKLNQVLEGFRTILPLAKSLGIHLAIENHDPLSMSPVVLKLVLDKLGSPRVGVCLDFGNFTPQKRYDALERLAPSALMVHAKSYRFNKTGEETSIDFKRCFGILNRCGFSGPVVAEYDGSGDQLLGSLRTKVLVERYGNAAR